MSPRIERLTGLQKMLPLVGLSFWQAWWMCTSTTDVVSGPHQYGIGAVSLLLVTTLVGYALLSLGAPRFAPYSCTRSFALTGAGGFAGTLLVSVTTHVFLPQAAGVAIMFAGSVVIALANALLLLMWGERWGTLAAGDVGRQLCISFASAFALYFLVAWLPTAVGIAVNACFPPLSAVALAVSQAEPRRTEPVAPVALKMRPVALALTSIFAFSVAYGCIQHVAGGGIDRGGHGILSAMAIAGLLTVCLALYMVVRSRAGNPFSFYRPIVPTVACGMIVCAMVPPDLSYLGNGLLIFGIYCLDMFIMFSTTDLAYRARLPIAAIFGATVVVARAGTWLGTLAGTGIARSVVPDHPGAATATVLALACVAVVAGTGFFNESDLRSIYQPEAKPHVPDLDERCDQIGASAGLSARELDVMRLLARGRSVAVISEALGIAPGTVKHHASNTYRKLGVYDRQGLIDVVAGDPGEGSAPAAGTDRA